MPTPYDLLSEKLDDQADPDDQLRLQLGDDQGANLAGGPQQGADGQPQLGAPSPGAPSPNVPGPLAALARKTPTLKPHIKLKSKPLKGKPKIKPKLKPKPKPSSPSSALQGFLNAIGTNPGS